jgi:DNA-directed RNA polymerase subunit RPC12/RpoP
MNKTVAMIVLAAGSILLGLGLLFLCASAAAPERAVSRILLGLVLALIGGGGAVWAGLQWRRLGEIEPARLADRIIGLVQTQAAPELTAAQATAQLGAPAANVQAALQLLQQRGEAQPEGRGDRVVYVFPGLKERKLTRHCVHCGTEFPVRQSLQRCPNCGGKIELLKN